MNSKHTTALQYSRWRRQRWRQRDRASSGVRPKMPKVLFSWDPATVLRNTFVTCVRSTFDLSCRKAAEGGG